MADGMQNPSLLTSREVQQLQLSLNNKSIREVALTVCTIRGLAKEVKSILQDLCYDEPPSVTQEPAMAPPNRYQNIPPIQQMPPLNKPIQRMGLGLGTRNFVKMLRRHRCPHCNRTFTTQSSVYRHIKSHHAHEIGMKVDRFLPAPPNLTHGKRHSASSSPNKSENSLATLVHDSESPNSASSAIFNQADTSVTTPRHASGTDENRSQAASPLASSSHNPSSPEDHLSPMPNLADMFTPGQDGVGVKNEPDESAVIVMSDNDADIEMTSPLHTHYQTEMDQANSMSMPELNCPPGVIQSGDAEAKIRAEVDSQLKNMSNNGSGMYQCTDCGWRSKVASSMRSHMLSHKGVLPFQCNVCSYKTNKKHVLIRHYTIHTGEKPHKCPICSFGSLDHVELLKHMTKSHPGIHPYTCTVCGHHATTTLLLKKHMKAEHSMTPPRNRIQSAETSSSTTTAAGPSAGSVSSGAAWSVNKINSASETIYSSSAGHNNSNTENFYTNTVNPDNQPVFPS